MSGYSNSTYSIGGQDTAHPQWGVKDADGRPVTTVEGLARALRCDQTMAVKTLLDPDNAEMAAAAPPELVTEAKDKARKKPGGGTPPPISTGNFVSWSNGKGRVDMLVSNGKVPGVDGDVEGTSKSPAARVVVWEGGKPTRKKVGVSTHRLRRIPPLTSDKKTADPAAALVTLAAEHDAACEGVDAPSFQRLPGYAVKTAYDRGTESWPGPDRTTLTREEWALGRAEHLVKVARGEVTRAGNDADLLHPDHPLSRGVLIDMAEVQETVRGILADSV